MRKALELMVLLIGILLALEVILIYKYYENEKPAVILELENIKMEKDFVNIYIYIKGKGDFSLDVIHKPDYLECIKCRAKGNLVGEGKTINLLFKLKNKKIEEANVKLLAKIGDEIRYLNVPISYKKVE